MARQHTLDQKLQRYAMSRPWRWLYGRCTGATLKYIRGEIVELYFSIRGNQLGPGLAHVHLPQHAATDTQICARSITSRRLNDEYGLAEFHVLHLAISYLYCSRVDVGGRAFHTSAAN